MLVTCPFSYAPDPDTPDTPFPLELLLERRAAPNPGRGKEPRPAAGLCMQSECGHAAVSASFPIQRCVLLLRVCSAH